MPRGKKFIDGFKDAPKDDEPSQMVLGMPASTYSPSGDVTEVAERLIANYPVQLGYLRNFRLVFLARSSSRADNEFHVQSAGGAFIRSDRERGIDASSDGGVWVDRKVWNGFSPEQRQAWLHGYLLRLGIAPKGGRLKMLKPDVVEWASIVRIYGAWAQPLTLFGEALGEHQGPGGTVDHSASKPGNVSRFPHTVQPGAIPPGPSSVN